MAYLRIRLAPVEWEPGERPHAVDVTTVDGETFRYVERRTTRIVTKERRSSQTQTIVSKSCSACGRAFGDEERRPILPGLDETMVLNPVDVPNYCPNCGARVIKEDA